MSTVYLKIARFGGVAVPCVLLQICTNVLEGTAAFITRDYTHAFLHFFFTKRKIIFLKILRRFAPLCCNKTNTKQFSVQHNYVLKTLKAWKSTRWIGKNLEGGSLRVNRAPTGRLSGVTEKNDKILSQDSR